MKKKYILKYRVSGFIAVQAVVTSNPFAMLYHLLDWATEHQRFLSGVTVSPYEIPF